MAFNTTGQTYTPAELTEQEREDWRGEMGVEKVGVAGGLIDTKIENLGVRNLLLDSGRHISNNNYFTASYYFSEAPKEGEKVRIVLKGKLGSDKDRWIFYNSGPSIKLKEVLKFSDDTAIYETTFNWIVGSTSNAYMGIYAFPDTGSSTSEIEWIKLVKGDTTNKEWQPSDGDFAKRNGDITENFNANIMTANQYLPFTGCHTTPHKGEDLKPYTLVRLKQNGFIDEKQPNWELLPAIKGEKGIFGVIYGLLEKPAPSKPTPSEPISSEPTPRKLIPTSWIIAALGDMPIFVCNENGNIEYGDRLTPSSIQGVAMKSTDLLDPFCGIAGMDVNFKDENDIVKIGITKE